MAINWNRRKYTEQQFISAWNQSASIAQVLKTLEINIFGSAYKTAKETAKELGLSKDHMTGQGHLKGKTHNWTAPRELQSVLVYGKHESGSRLLNRLVSDRLKEKICESCGLLDWLGKPIPLELDHINGDSKDNRINNLRLLCPNCHALTPTWRGRNRGHVSQLVEESDSKPD